MDSLIKLLPDNIANQIAAGEVIQRPSSVVKELVENAVDAGATEIFIDIKDAGKTLIQVIDNGKGMAPMDARMAFERHATSKISSADDLFALTTMGFRGEALPSIAAVSHITLQTRAEDCEQGIRLDLEASKVVDSQPAICAQGANFSVKHLFFNVPARRKFLKRDETEYRHIVSEVENVAAVRPQVAFTLRHNEVTTFELKPSSVKQRLINLFGKRFESSLLPVDIDTPLVHITGFVTKVSATRKRGMQQYFFVNERYMKHSLFHRMILNAYGSMIPSGEYPEYFLFFTVDPSSIDVNISPTKTEIKFAAEQEISTILYSAVREVLMAGAAVPNLDFDRDESIPVAHTMPSEALVEPPITSDVLILESKMNKSKEEPPVDLDILLRGNDFQMPDLSDWDKFYDNFEGKRTARKATQSSLIDHLDQKAPIKEVHYDRQDDVIPTPTLYDHYAVYPSAKGLVVADIDRVRYKVLYERMKRGLMKGVAVSHSLLFPSLIELSAKDAELLNRHLATLNTLGFDLSHMGDNSFAINAVPEGISAGAEEELLQQILSECQGTLRSSEDVLTDMLVRKLINFKVKQTAHSKLSPVQAQELLQELYTLPEYLMTPDGQNTITIITPIELERRFH